METSYGLIQLFKDGGWMMYPLLLASLLGLGVMIAKVYVLWVAQRGSGKLLAAMEQKAASGRVDEVLEQAERTPGPVAAILVAGLNPLRAGRPAEEVEQGMDAAGKLELGFLERGMVLLATVASVAPLLGFLGTVWGMIEAFAAIEAAGQVEASLVASGIKIALITTAAGLIIAIPVNTAYNYFVTRIDRLIVEMDEATAAVLNLVWDLTGTGGAAAVAGAPAGVAMPTAKPAGRRLEGDDRGVRGVERESRGSAAPKERE
ncbi:MAG TPA: MotA/TolQ/ExbB proton channel family protein [Longimicrobiaceae bacterium]